MSRLTGLITLRNLILFIFLFSASSTLVLSLFLINNRQEKRIQSEAKRTLVSLVTLLERFSGEEKFKEYARISNEFKVYACVVNGENFFWASDNFAEQLCRDKRFTPRVSTGTVLNMLFQKFDNYEEPMYQITRGGKPRFRILVKQKFYRDKMAIFQIDLMNSFFYPILICLGLMFALICWALRPLERLRKDVNALGSGRLDQISTVGYPRDLSHFAKKLQDVVLQARRTRGDIVEKAFKLSCQMQHHRKNLLPMLNSDDIDTFPPKKLLEMLSRIIKSSDSFITEICAIGQKDVPLELEKVEVFGFFRELVGIFEQDYRNIELHLEGLEKDIWAHVPTRVLEEICYELLSNAGKYAASIVLIRIAKRNRSICLDFHNDGQKFPVDNRENMFRWDCRGDTAHEGSGRGLYFVKQRVDTWGGQVRLGDSGELGGACVRVELPAA